MNMPRRFQDFMQLFILVAIATSVQSRRGVRKKKMVVDKCGNQDFDIYFMVEASSFIGQSNLNAAKTFFKSILNGFELGGTNTHVSVTSYGKGISEDLKLRDSVDKANINKVISNMQVHNGYGVWTHTFMDYANKNLFTEAQGRRKDLPAVCILLAGYTFSGNYITAAKELRENCRVIVIGVKYYRMTQLYAVASKPTSKHAMHSRKYSDIMTKVKPITESICYPPLASPRLKRSRIRHDSLSVEWNKQPYATGYDAMLRARKAPRLLIKKFGLNKDTSSVTFTGLRESTQYFVYVWPIDSKHQRGPQATLIVTTGIKMPVISVDPMEITSNTAIVRWDRTLRGGKNHIYATAEDDDKNVITQTAAGRSTVLERLTPGTTYVALLGSIYMPRQDLQELDGTSFMTDCIPPKMTLIDMGLSNITLVWNITKGAAHYNLFVKSIENDKTIKIVNVTGPTYVVENLSPTLTYEITNVCVNKYNSVSVLGETVNVFKAPPNPKNIKIYNVTTTSMQLNWELIKDARRYQITIVDVWGESGPDKSRTRYTSNKKSWFDDLEPGTLYEIFVYSLGKGDKKNVLLVFPVKFSTVPKEPRNIQSESQTNSFQLKWNAIKGAAKYEIYKRSYEINYEERDKVFTAEPITEHFVILANTTKPEFEMNHLDPASSFVFKIRSVGQFGLPSNFSEHVWVQTLPSKELNGYVLELSEYHATITWKGSEGVYLYMVLVSTDGENVAQYKTRDNKLRLNRLIPGGIYSVSIFPMQVRARLNIHHSEKFGFQTIPLPPKELKVNSPNSTTFFVECDRVKGAMGYKFVFDASKSSELSQQNTSKSFVIHGSNQGFIDGFDPGSVYSVRVHAINFNEEESRSSNVIDMTTRPPPPRMPTVVSFGKTFLDLKWDPVQGVETFELTLSEVRYTNETSRTWVINNIENNKINLKSLKPGMVYSIVLRNENRFHTEGQTSETLYTQTSLSMPSGFASDLVSTNEATVHWNEVFGAQKYTVSKLDIDEEDALAEMVTVETNTHRFTGLDPGTMYEFRVKPQSDYAREGNWSSTISVVTDPLPPPRPSLNSSASSCITVQWQSSKGAFGYVASVSNYAEDHKQQSLGLSVDVCGLTPDTPYNVSVRAEGARSMSTPSEILPIRTTLAPPTNLKIQGVDEKEAELQWDDISGFSTYVITLLWNDHYNVRNERVVKSTTNSISLQQLEPNIRYSYTVQVLNVDGLLSEKSPEQTFATNVKQDPPTIVAITTTSLSISWDINPGIVVYELTVQGKEGNDFQTKARALNPPETIGGLEPGTKFDCFVIALGELDVEMARSNFTSVQTLTEPANNFAATEVGEDAMTLTWGSVFGAVSYVVYVYQSNGVKVADIETDYVMTLVEELIPGTSYSFELWTIGDNEQRSMEAATLEESTVPVPPKNVVVTNATESNFFLEWEHVLGAVSYYALIQSGEWKTDYDVFQPSLLVTDLKPDTLYNVTIFSVGEKNRLNPVGSAVKTTRTAPPPPTEVVADHITDVSSYIRWYPVSDAVYYSLAFWKNESRNPYEENRFDTWNSSFVLDFLHPSHEYAISLQTVGVTGLYSKPTPPLRFVTKPSTPEQPSVLNITATTALLNWTQSTDASSYIVHLYSIGDNTTTKLQASENEVIVESLLPGEKYQVSIQSVGPHGDLSLKLSLPIDFQTRVYAPQNFHSTTIDLDFIGFEWTPVYGASAYSILSYTEEGLLMEDKITFDNNVTFDMLQPGHSYTFVIAAIDEYQRKSVDENTLLEHTLPEHVMVYLDSITSEEVSVHWSEGKGAVSYVALIQSGEWETELTTFNASLVVTGLEPDTLYNVTIFSVGPRNRLNPKGSEIKTTRTAPSPPSEIVADHITDFSSYISWTPVPNAIYYTLTLWNNNTNSSNWDQETRFDTLNSSFIVDYLEPSQEYAVSVQTVGVTGLYSIATPFVPFITKPAYPEQPDVMDITATTVLLSLTQATGAVSYMALIQSGEWETEVEAFDVSLLVTDLKPDTMYNMTIFSVGPNNLLNPEGSELTTIRTAPSPPSEIVAEDITDFSAHIKWTPVPNAVYYSLTMWNNNSSYPDEGIQFHTSNSSFIVDSLEPSQEYDISVQTVGVTGLYSKSTPDLTFITKSSTPEQPNIENVTDTTAFLSLTKATGAVSYVALIQSGEWETEVNAFELNLLVTGLKADTLYNVTIFSVDENNHLNPEGSELITIRTAPLPPSEVVTDHVTDVISYIKWTPVSGALFYSLSLWNTESYNAEEEARFETYNNSFIVDSLDPSHEYSVSVKTVGVTGLYSKSSPSLTFITKPSTPQQPSVLNVTATTAHLFWAKSTDASSYIVHLYCIGDNTTTKLQASENEVIVESLLPGEKYQVSIQAVGPQGDLSLRLSLPNIFQALIPPPQDFQSNKIDLDFIGLDWMPVYGASAYSIKAYTESGLLIEEKITFAHDITFHFLQPGSSYTFVITSIDQHQRKSIEANTLHETTLPEQVKVFLKSVASEEIAILWNEVKGAVLYRVFTAGPNIDKPSVIMTSKPDAIVKNLTPGEWYTFVVFACDSKNRSEHYGSIPLSVQTIPSVEEQMRQLSKLSISRIMKEFKNNIFEPIPTSRSQLKIVLDPPINKQIVPEDYSEGGVIHKSLSSRSSSIEAESLSCSMECRQSSVVKDFVP